MCELPSIDEESKNIMTPTSSSSESVTQSDEHVDTTDDERRQMQSAHGWGVELFYNLLYSFRCNTSRMALKTGGCIGRDTHRAEETDVRTTVTTITYEC
jgi:hypothetical protein